MNLWRMIKVQAALALFVVAAFTQLAHAAAGPRSPLAVADKGAATYYAQRALDAMGARGEAMASHYRHEAAAQSKAFDPGVLFPNGDPTSPGYVAGAPADPETSDFVPGLTDFPTGVTDLAPGSAIQVTDESFDWNDAGLGALSALGTCLLLAGCGFLAVSHRKRKPAVL